MARKVFVSSAMSADEELSEIADHEPLIALIWPWFITYFDDWGRAKASPREIKNNVFQANPLITIDVIKRALQLYHPKLIRLYEVEGKWYMCVPAEKWFKFQTHIRSGKRDNDGSKIPAPPDLPHDDDNSAQVREIARGIAEVSAGGVNLQPSPSPSLSPSPSNEPTTTPIDDEPNAFKLYELEKFGFLTPGVGEEIGALIDEYTEEWVKWAIKEASVYGKRYLPYVKKILVGWKALNHPEPWTVEKQAPQQDSKVHHLNQRRGGYQHPQKPKLEPGTVKSNQATPEELEQIRGLARKLDSSKQGADVS